MKLRDFDALSFDCYGTLIDWESGILTAWRPWAVREGVDASDNAVLERFAANESRQQTETPGLPYPEILARTFMDMAADFGRTPVEADAVAFGRSVPDWPAFPDSAATLDYLGRHYELIVLSNVDRESFAASAERLGTRFDAVFTAQDVGSYKPAAANFDALVAGLEARGMAKARVLHTAQSLFHDHVPAAASGFATCWIDRRKDRPGWGATMPPPSEVQVDFHFGSMAELVEAHRREA